VRRRSGRVQRETPRDLLRNLSRVLARDTQPIPPTPRTQARASRRSALDLPDIDDDEPAAPRFSMPLDDMYDDDSFNEEPPRPSLLAPLPDYDYDNGTVQSVEFGRRARSEDPRMDRMFGRRISEQFGDLQDLEINGDEYGLDGNFINRRGTLLPNDLLEQVEEEEDLDNTTSEIRALTGRRDGRPSDVDLGVFGDADGEQEEEPTFRFTIPPRMQVPVEDEEDGEEDGAEGDENAQGRVDGTIIEDDEDGRASVDLASNDETAPALADDDDRDDVTGPLEIAGWESEPEAADDEDLQAYRGEVSAVDRSLQTPAPETPAKKRPGRQRSALNISRFGHEYPSFPAATVKTLANGLIKSQGSKAKLSKDTLAALVQTSDFFFEQVGEDLAAYAQHAGRKMIEEGDVIALLKRYVHVMVLFC
jgi:histone H3/H4